jgi:hypothetical protein
MKSNHNLWFFNKLRSNSSCLLYNGIFSDDITTRILELYESYIESQGENPKIKKRFVFLFVEIFQNIIRHGSQSMDDNFNTLNHGFFMVSNNPGKYYFVSGNSIENKNVGILKNHLELINKMDKDELDAFHLKIINEDRLSEKGGAGLGLINMARKSGQKLLYKFEKSENDLSIFYNQVVLKSETESTHIEDDIDIDFAVDLHKEMVEETILMLQKGDFSSKSILSDLKIIEDNIVSDPHGSGYRREVFNVLVELLLNISKHSCNDNKSNTGIFSLSKKDGKYVICAGNLMERNKKDALKFKLESLNTLNKEEIKNLYIQKLKNTNNPVQGDSGIGLINVARLQTEKIKYSFDEYDNNLLFFTISVII